METKIIKLDNLFFDPNNYRLRSNPNYKFVDHKNELKEAIQKRTQNLITGEKNFLIHELLESFKSNGFLKVDNILVRKYNDSDNYIVIEGNRRLAALKALNEQKNNGFDIGAFDNKYFEEGLEVVVYHYENEMDYLVLMGLKHVSGNKKWDTYNQAKLLYELKEKGINTTEISQKIGLKKPEVEKQIRGYLAGQEFINETSLENYGNDFNPYDKLMIFIELTNNERLREWIGWDSEKKIFENVKNKERFYSWIKPLTENNEETGDDLPIPAIITSHKQVRLLPEIIDDEDTLLHMEDTRDFELALNSNRNYTKKKFSNTLKDVEKIMRNIPLGASLCISDEDEVLLNNIKIIVDKLLRTKNDENQ